MKSKYMYLSGLLVLSMLSMGSIPVTTTGANYGNDEFLDALNAALYNIVEDGTYDTIYTTHFEGAVNLVDDEPNSAQTFPSDPTDGGTLADIIAAGEIVFGSDTTYPPFESIDTDGVTVVGFDADIADAVAAEFTTAFGTTITATMMTTAWDPIIPDLKAGNFDAILSAMTKTPERDQEIDFTRAYYTSSQGVLQGTLDLPAGVTVSTVDDLNVAGIKIALQSGTTSDLYAADNLGNAEILAFDSFDLVIDALEADDAHFALADFPVLSFYASANAGFDVIDSFSDENFGIGVREDTEEAPDSADDDGIPVSIWAFLLGMAAIPVAKRFNKK